MHDHILYKNTNKLYHINIIILTKFLAIRILLLKSMQHDILSIQNSKIYYSVFI